MTVAAYVVVVTLSCWRCSERTTAVAGVLIAPELHPDGDPWGFVPFSDVAAALAAIDSQWCARRGIGTLKERYSRAQQRRYVSNGCVSCDALQGEFFISEELTDLIVNGVSFADLVVGAIQLPVRAIPDDETSMSFGCGPPRPGELEQLAREHR